MNIEYVSKKVVDYLAGDEFYKEPIKTLEDYLCMDGFEEMLVPDFINRYEKTNSDPNAWQEVNELYDVIKLYICEWLITLLQEQGNEIEEYNNYVRQQVSQRQNFYVVDLYKDSGINFKGLTE